MKNLEIQVGQLSKQIAEKASDNFSGNIANNPNNESWKAKSLRNGKLTSSLIPKL